MSTSLQGIQTAKILQHLEKVGPITPIEALREYKCMRLAARIYDLRKSGVGIETDTIHAGEVHYAQYTLKVP